VHKRCAQIEVFHVCLCRSDLHKGPAQNNFVFKFYDFIDLFYILKEMRNSKLLYFSFLILVVIAALHSAALTNYYYWIYSWFDLLVHFLGGVWVSVTALWLYFFSGLFSNPKISKMTVFWLSILAVLLSSLLWEIYEVGLWRHLSEPNFLTDTIGDTLAALAGSYVVFISFSNSYENLTDKENE